jgi:hypothetical protein
MSAAAVTIESALASGELRGLTRARCDKLFALLRALMHGGAPSDSWEDLAGVLQRHRLEALVYGRLSGSAAGAAGLPDAFRSGYLRNVQRNARYRDEALRITEAAGDVPFVFLQGMGLLSQLQADPGERRLSDLDVLVAPRDELRFLAAVQRLGYSAKGAARLISWNYPGHWELAREAEPGQAFCLDASCGTLLPVSLFTRHTRLEAAEILHRAVVRDGLLVPDPADLLALCVLNIEQKDFGWLRGYVDVSELAASCSQAIDWRIVASALSRHGNRGITGAILAACRRWFGAPIPDWVVEECSFAGSPFVQGWEAFFLDPAIVCSQRAVGVRGGGRLPPLLDFFYGMNRRLLSFRSWPVRAQILTEALTESFDGLNGYLYHARSAVGRAFARCVVNPLVVALGWAVLHSVFVASGSVLWWVFARRTRVGLRSAP